MTKERTDTIVVALSDRTGFKNLALTDNTDLTQEDNRIQEGDRAINAIGDTGAAFSQAKPLNSAGDERERAQITSESKGAEGSTEAVPVLDNFWGNF